MKLYLIRHTAVDVPQGICYGQTDVPLRASFEEEAYIVKCKLGNIVPDIVYSSPLSRCTRLANYCGFEKMRLDDRIMEFNFGNWENCEWKNVDMSAWKTDWINNPVPGGESFTMMYKRVANFFDELKNNEAHNIIIFTHGGVICCARVYFGQTDMYEAFDSTPQYGEIKEFII